ncbi:MAG: hypothetical protein ABS876_06930 [Ruminococcus sp.]
MLSTQNSVSTELAEAVELVENLKKLPPMEQTFLKGYIQGMLAKLGEDTNEQKTLSSLGQRGGWLIHHIQSPRRARAGAVPGEASESVLAWHCCRNRRRARADAVAGGFLSERR